MYNAAGSVQLKIGQVLPARSFYGSTKTELESCDVAGCAPG